MPLVTRWGSEVRTVSPLEPGPEDPKPKALDSRPLPFTQLGQAYNRLPFFENPAPLKKNFQHPLPPELPDPPLAGLDITGVQVIPAPANGLDLTSASVQVPANGLDLDDASVPVPANGLDIASVAITIDKPVAGLDINDTSVTFDKPVAGLDIDDTSVTIDKPVAGLDITGASVQAPAAGLDIDDASVIPPANGLDITDTDVTIDKPVAGLDIADASVQSPVAGLDIDVAGLAPPVAGLDVDNVTVFNTLNIEIVSSSDFALDPSTGTEGEIKYSSEDGFIWIHNGTEWHKTDGV
jgi:hypothetical protein